MSWVLDASVALRWLLKAEVHPHAEQVLKKLVAEPGLFAVPELFSYEVYAVLCQLHPDPLGAYVECIVPILQGGLTRFPMTARLASVAYAYTRKGLTGYDACYAALAEELDGVWLTFDAKTHARLKQSGRSCLLSTQIPAELKD